MKEGAGGEVSARSAAAAWEAKAAAAAAAAEAAEAAEAEEEAASVATPEAKGETPRPREGRRARGGNGRLRLHLRLSPRLANKDKEPLPPKSLAAPPGSSSPGWVMEGPGRWRQLSRAKSFSRGATWMFEGPGRWARHARGAKPLSGELAEPHRGGHQAPAELPEELPGVEAGSEALGGERQAPEGAEEEREATAAHSCEMQTLEEGSLSKTAAEEEAEEAEEAAAEAEAEAEEAAAEAEAEAEEAEACVRQFAQQFVKKLIQDTFKDAVSTKTEHIDTDRCG